MDRFHPKKAFSIAVSRYFGALALAIGARFVFAYLFSYVILGFGFDPSGTTTGHFLINWLYSDIVSYGIPILILMPLLYKNALKPSVFNGRITATTLLLFPSFVLVGTSFSRVSIGFAEWLEKITGLELLGNPIDSMGPNDGFQFVLFLIFVCVIAPILEEILYREVLFKPLLPYGNWFAVITTAVWFGLVHGNMLQFGYATAVGIFLGYARLKSGSLFVPIILHVANNLVVAASDTLGKMDYAFAGVLSHFFSLFYFFAMVGGIITLPYLIYKGYFRDNAPGIPPPSQKASVMLKNPLFWICIVLLLLTFVL